MSVGSAFDERALELNVRRQWREWSGVFSSSAYAPHIDIEYNALRNAAALIDVSPLFKYRVGGPGGDVMDGGADGDLRSERFVFGER